MTPLPSNFLKCMPKSERQRLGKAGRTDAEVQEDIEFRLEKDLQKHIGNLLSQRDIWFGRSKMHKRSRYTKGAPDFLFAWRDLPVAIEAKIDNKAPSIDQLRCHAHMRRNGWSVYVVRSIEEVRKILQ